MFLDRLQIDHDGTDILTAKSEFRHVWVARDDALAQSFLQGLDRVAAGKSTKQRSLQMSALSDAADGMARSAIAISPDVQCDVATGPAISNCNGCERDGEMSGCTPAGLTLSHWICGSLSDKSSASTRDGLLERLSARGLDCSGSRSLFGAYGLEGRRANPMQHSSTYSLR